MADKSFSCGLLCFVSVTHLLHEERLRIVEIGGDAVSQVDDGENKGQHDRDWPRDRHHRVDTLWGFRCLLLYCSTIYSEVRVMIAVIALQSMHVWGWKLLRRRDCFSVS